jgi:hypothetical protein
MGFLVAAPANGAGMEFLLHLHETSDVTAQNVPLDPARRLIVAANGTSVMGDEEVSVPKTRKTETPEEIQEFTAGPEESLQYESHSQSYTVEFPAAVSPEKIWERIDHGGITSHLPCPVAYGREHDHLNVPHSGITG